MYGPCENLNEHFSREGERKSGPVRDYYLLTSTEEQAFQAEYMRLECQEGANRTWEDDLYDSFYSHRQTDSPIPPPVEDTDNVPTLKNIARDLEYPPLNRANESHTRRRGVYIPTANYVQNRDTPYYRELQGNFRDFEIEYKQPSYPINYNRGAEISQRSQIADWLEYTNWSCPPEEPHECSSYSEYTGSLSSGRRQQDNRHLSIGRARQRGRLGANGSVTYPIPDYDVLERIREVYEQIETITNELRYLKSIAPKRKKRHGFNYYKFNPSDW